MCFVKHKSRGICEDLFIYLFFFFNVAKLHKREVLEKELRWMRNVGAISRGKKTIDGI